MSVVTIQIEPKTVIELHIDDRLTVIGGDSGSGRTYLITSIYNCLKNHINVHIHGAKLENFIVCRNEQELGQIDGKRHKIIIIDRYDIYSRASKEKLRDAMEKEDNTWLVMTRSPDFEFSHNIGFSMRSFKEIKTKTENGINYIYLVRS